MMEVTIGKSKYRISSDYVVEKLYRGEWIVVKQGRARNEAVAIATAHRKSLT